MYIYSFYLLRENVPMITHLAFMGVSNRHLLLNSKW